MITINLVLIGKILLALLLTTAFFSLLSCLVIIIGNVIDAFVYWDRDFLRLTAEDMRMSIAMGIAFEVISVIIIIIRILVLKFLHI